MPDVVNLNPVETRGVERPPTKKLKRIISWVFVGVVASILPIDFGALAHQSIKCNDELGKRTIYENMFNTKLLMVGFTLGCAATVDALTNALNSVWNHLVGVVTLLMIIITIFTYFTLKSGGFGDHGIDNIEAVQIVFSVTLLLSFACEVSAPA
jgi:hypothetical protein